MDNLILTPEGLRYLRIFVLGLSQSDLARELGVSRNAVSAWERGAAAIERRTDLAITYLVLRQYGKA